MGEGLGGAGGGRPRWCGSSSLQVGGGGRGQVGGDTKDLPSMGNDKPQIPKTQNSRNGTPREPPKNQNPKTLGMTHPENPNLMK